MCLGFLALGTWQIFRLQWKLDLIERVERRVHAPAVPAPGPAAWAAVSKQADEYRHVMLSGHWLPGADALVQATTELGSGYWLMSPFCTVDGAIVLVNRGFVPPTRPKPAKAGAPGCTGAPAVDQVTGLLRLPEPGGGYLRSNDPIADRWFSRDVAAIAASRKLGAVAPFFVDQEKSAAPAPGEPVGGLTVLSFTNNHLVYALTWFALAVMAAVGAWLLLRKGRR
jgi:surfeit locus 1 family protein